MKKEYEILGYKCTYYAIINYLHGHYRPLRPLMGIEEEDKLIFYQAKESAYQCRGFFSDCFNSTCKYELNEFLKNIYVTRDSQKEGAIVLFRWLHHAFNHYQDRHFRYHLAKVVFWLAATKKNDNPAIQFVKLQGEKSAKIELEIKRVCQSAQKIIDQYERKDDKPVLQYPPQFYIIKYGI